MRDSAEEDEVRKIARVRTLTVLPRLNASRKGSVLQFLYEASLIDRDKTIIDLSQADLRGALTGFGTLSKANLSDTYLMGVNLMEADLSQADLSGAKLTNAFVLNTNLRSAVLINAQLSNADLFGADFKDAKVTEEQLKKAKSLKGAIMPDGSIHP